MLVQLIVGDGALLSHPDTLTVTADRDADVAIQWLNPPAGTLPPGTTVTFAARVTNLGPLDTTDVSALAQLPAGYTPLALTPSVGSYDAGSGTWTIGPLAVSATADLSVEATVNAAGPLALTASISTSSRSDPDSSNNAAHAAPPNRPPVAHAGADRLVTSGATVVLDGAASSDADGDALTFEWTLTARPAGSVATLSGATSSGASFVADRNGQFIVELRVSDSSGSSAADIALVTAAANHPPIITSSPVTSGRAGAPYTYAVLATDADPGDTLIFSLPIAPAGMSIDRSTGLVQWTPLGNQTGRNQVAVHVRDRAGLFAAQGFTLEVETGTDNEAPSAQDDRYDARTGDSLSVPAPGVLGNDSDPEGNRISARALTQPANGTALVNRDGSFTYTPFTFQEGELVLADNVNLATNLTGTIARVTSSLGPTVSAAQAIDGSLGTSWRGTSSDNASLGPRSLTGGPPFIEVEFPQSIEVQEMRAIGHRDPTLATHRILAGKFQLFDAENTEIFDSGAVDLPLPNRDGKVSVPDLFQRSRNIARTATGVTFAASSSNPGEGPQAAFDRDLRTQWRSAFTPPPHFIEAVFAAPVAVHRINIFGSRTSRSVDFLAFVVQVFDAAGAVLFDSGTINVTAANSDTTVNVGGVSGARRCTRNRHRGRERNEWPHRRSRSHQHRNRHHQAQRDCSTRAIHRNRRRWRGSGAGGVPGDRFGADAPRTAGRAKPGTPAADLGRSQHLRQHQRA